MEKRRRRRRKRRKRKEGRKKKIYYITLNDIACSVYISRSSSGHDWHL